MTVELVAVDVVAERGDPTFVDALDCEVPPASALRRESSSAASWAGERHGVHAGSRDLGICEPERVSET